MDKDTDATELAEEQPGELEIETKIPDFRALLLSCATQTKIDEPSLEGDDLTGKTWERFNQVVVALIEALVNENRRDERRKLVGKLGRFAKALQKAMVQHKKDCPAILEPPGPCLCGAGRHNAQIAAAFREP